MLRLAKLNFYEMVSILYSFLDQNIQLVKSSVVSISSHSTSMIKRRRRRRRRQGKQQQGKGFLEFDSSRHLSINYFTRKLKRKNEKEILFSSFQNNFQRISYESANFLEAFVRAKCFINVCQTCLSNNKRRVQQRTLIAFRTKLIGIVVMVE